MKLNIKRFAGDPTWIITTEFKNCKYKANGELVQFTIKISSSYNIGSIYDLDDDGDPNWAYSLWDVHNASDSAPHSTTPYIERTYTNLDNITGVRITTYEGETTQSRTIQYNFTMGDSGNTTTTYITKTSGTAVLHGNVINNLSSYDMYNAPSIAAVRNMVESGGIVRSDGSVNKIIKCDYSQYLDLANNYRVDSNTEYHIAETATSQSTIEGFIRDIILASHPIGSIEMNITGDNPSTYLGGTWIQVSQGRAVFGEGTCSTTYNVNGTSQTFSNTYEADTNYAAGLPNINGTGHYADNNASWSGALYQAGTANYIGDGSASGTLIGLEASRNRAIYGRSNTVQPNAYVVYVWKRTA